MIETGAARGASTATLSPAAARWVIGGLLVTGFGVVLALLSPRFGYAYEVGDMPVVWLTAGLVLAGLAYALCLPRLIADSAQCDPRQSQAILVCIVAAGLAARLVLFASEPMLEDDYQRYLWDGAVTASGKNPYAMSPRDARAADDAELSQLAGEAGPVLGRINHPDLKSVYPPVAQAAFALAYNLKPWSLSVWRAILLLFDLATLGMIVLLLREVGRSPLWSALYWWNPVVIKELFNSAHMEAIVLPFVLAALWLALRSRPVAAALSLAVAVGAKIWPALLLPLVLRQLGFDPRRLLAPVGAFVAVIALWVMPVWLGGMSEQSGFVAYLSSWQTNSALFPALERAVSAVLGVTMVSSDMAGPLSRGMIALGLVAAALLASRKPIESPDDLMGRASLVVGALVLLSPAQFPWYTIWFAPFLAFRPWIGFLLLTATVPLYYLDFYFLSRDRPEIFDDVVVWIIWVPVWTALAFETLRKIRPPMPA